MNKQSKKLIVIAGGSGGHIFPAISVAHYLISLGWKVRWLGSSNRIEANLVPKYGIEFDFIKFSGLRGKKIKTLLLNFIYIIKSYYRARFFIKRFKPDVVLGMGGYISIPGGLAAWSLGIPIIIHEQNAIAGLANKCLSKIATKVIQGFSGAFPNMKVVGNPVRKEIISLPNPESRFLGRKGPIRILVLGGSQGSNIFNLIMPQVAEKLGPNVIDILHQTGIGADQMVESFYVAAKSPIKHKVVNFIENIATAYAWADVIICRAGALTVSEIIAVGLPALFVPFKHKNRHQYWNALPLERIGAAKILDQSDFTVDSVSKIISSWNREILLKMAKLAKISIDIDATACVAKEIMLTANM